MKPFLKKDNDEKENYLRYSLGERLEIRSQQTLQYKSNQLNNIHKVSRDIDLQMNFVLSFQLKFTYNTIRNKLKIVKSIFLQIPRVTNHITEINLIVLVNYFLFIKLNSFTDQ